MKRFLMTGLAFLLTFSMMTGYTSAAAATADNSLYFDFEKDDGGFTPIYADYPNSEGVENFYEFRHSYEEIPIDGAGKGIFISGNNHSDDLFMGYVKTLEGLAPARTYHVTVSFKLATDVDSGQVGVGGSPGESVTVKCGLTQTQPVSIVYGTGEYAYYRLNIDAGQQSNGGKDMVVVGDMAKTENNRPGEYEFKEFQAEFDVAANILGEIFLIIGTDSGFEATTSYYLDDISVSWVEAAVQPIVTRGQAAQMLFHTADRPSADPATCPFRDVTDDNYYVEAITWAQESGYLVGYGNWIFGPEESMTVEQAMVMIYRFFGSPATDISVLDGINGSDQISFWAKDAAAWTIANEIFQPGKTVFPHEPITVEELSACLGQIVVAY